MTQPIFSTGQIATLACLLEVAAPKPGNVHRGADFEDLTLQDFMASAVAIGGAIDELSSSGVGDTIYEAINRTATATQSNTNLGMVLLIVPLAKAALTGSIDADSVKQILTGLTAADGRAVYNAIAIASPGGMGTVAEMDVNDQTASANSHDLLKAMKLAADRDLIARQYGNGFEQILDEGVSLLDLGNRLFETLSHAIVFAHVSIMSRFPDSLIARKCGVEMANQSKMMAAKVIEKLGDVETEPAKLSAQRIESYWAAVGELDFWLRSDGNKRNPGTTADIVAASLFVAIHNGQITPPFS